jgi:transposase
VAYKALFRQGMMEAGCMAHARRKFHELYANHQSQIAEEALKLFGVLYDVERQAQKFDIDARRAARQQLGKPAADTLHAWLLAQR